MYGLYMLFTWLLTKLKWHQNYDLLIINDAFKALKWSIGAPLFDLKTELDQIEEVHFDISLNFIYVYSLMKTIGYKWST